MCEFLWPGFNTLTHLTCIIMRSLEGDKKSVEPQIWLLWVALCLRSESRLAQFTCSFITINSKVKEQEKVTIRYIGKRAELHVTTLLVFNMVIIWL